MIWTYRQYPKLNGHDHDLLKHEPIDLNPLIETWLFVLYTVKNTVEKVWFLGIKLKIGKAQPNVLGEMVVYEICLL